jgi:glycosyltransferase involved in cell wall biosynthesis
VKLVGLIGVASVVVTVIVLIKCAAHFFPGTCPRVMPDDVISVMHVIDTGGPGGAETVFLQMATGLNPARFRSVAVVGDNGWLPEQLEKHSLVPHILAAKGSFKTGYLLALRRLVRHRKIDVIVAHLYGSAIYASLLAPIMGVPVVSVLHGQSDVAHSDRLAPLRSWIVRMGSRKVVFVSKHLKDHLAPRLRLPESQCAVIPNGVDAEVFRPCQDRSLRSELAIADDVILVGAIGNIRAPKAYDVLLRAARILLHRSQRIHFIIAGDCSNALGRELVGLSRSLGIEQQVSFLGLRADVARILRNLDAFVLSSRTEGFSIACIEAMACGIPVVATRSGGPEEILEGGAGILVPTDDPEAIAQAVEEVTSSKGLAEELTTKALNRVQQQYSLVRMVSRYEALLENLIRRPRHQLVNLGN